MHCGRPCLTAAAACRLSLPETATTSTTTNVHYYKIVQSLQTTDFNIIELFPGRSRVIADVDRVDGPFRVVLTTTTTRDATLAIDLLVAIHALDGHWAIDILHGQPLLLCYYYYYYDFYIVPLPTRLPRRSSCMYVLLL